MSSVIVNILLFILVLGVLVFVHELGHFLAAKSVKATIYEFSLGFGPILFKKKRKSIQYSIRAIPLGGYVKVAGDGDPGDEKLRIKEEKDKNSLSRKSKLAQAWVMSAGVIMNIILAVSIYYIILGFNGWIVSLSSYYKDFKPIGAEVSYEKYEDVTYDGFSKNSNAKDAGMPESGVIKKVEGEEIEYTYDLERVLEGKEGSIVKVTICEKNECSDYSVKVSEQGYLGIVVAVNYYVVISYEDNKLTAGFSHLLNILKLSAERISGLFTEAKETGDYSEVANTFSGPVGIYLIIDYFKQFGFWSIISIMADLSLSLAIMNILPIPALDGGRIVILLSESIARKDLNEETEALIINISFCILMVLVAVIFVKDILTIDSLRSMFE